MPVSQNVLFAEINKLKKKVEKLQEALKKQKDPYHMLNELKTKHRRKLEDFIEDNIKLHVDQDYHTKEVFATWEFK